MIAAAAVPALVAGQAVAATAATAAHSAVAEVIPDVTIHGAQPDQAAALGTVTKKAAKVQRTTSAPTSLTPHVIPGACSSGKAQLDPEGLALMNVDSDNPNAKTARSRDRPARAGPSRLPWSGSFVVRCQLAVLRAAVAQSRDYEWHIRS